MYGLQLGSGGRNSSRLAFGDCENIGIRTAAERLRARGETRIGLLFLALSIVMLYKGGAGKRLAQARAMQSEPPRKAWKDPWGTG